MLPMLPPGARVAARARRRQRHAARAWAAAATSTVARPLARRPRNPQTETPPGARWLALVRPRPRPAPPARPRSLTEPAESRSVGSARPRSVTSPEIWCYTLHATLQLHPTHLGYVLQFSASALPPCAREQTDRRVDGQARGERPRHPKHLLLCKLARRRTAQLPELARVLLA